MICNRCQLRDETEIEMDEVSMPARREPGGEETEYRCPECGIVWRENDGELGEQVLRLAPPDNGYVLWIEELDAGYREVREWPETGETDTERVIDYSGYLSRIRQALGVDRPIGLLQTPIDEVAAEFESVDLLDLDAMPG